MNPPEQPSTWHGTPIPRVDDPINPTPELEAIASRIWWHGPPAMALRNANAFLWQIMDYANDEDIDTALRAIERKRWLRAINEAPPRHVSRGAVILWRLRFGLPTEHIRQTWPRHTHRNDIKPLANESRERLYERHRIRHELNRPTGNSGDCFA